MRYLAFVALGLVLAYFEAGLVVIFGSVTLLALGYLGHDIQSQTQQLTKAVAAQGELLEDRADVTNAALETLRGDLASAVSQLRATQRELAALRPSVPRGPKGPWES